MRLYLLPLTRNGAPSQCLLYCHRPVLAPISSTHSERPPIIERATVWSAKKWHEWEHVPSGWKKKVTAYGNQMFKRLPHQEWGLKSMPPRRLQGMDRVAFLWPRAYTDEAHCRDTLVEMGGKEKQSFHRKRLWWSILAMPLTAPMVLVPVIPNLPFFYLCFRAWSHWKAREGSRHLAHLLQNGLLEPRASELMKRAYDLAILVTSIERLEDELVRIREGKGEESEAAHVRENMILSKHSGKIIADALDVPALEEEIERAIWQVKRGLREEAKKGIQSKQ